MDELRKEFEERTRKFHLLEKDLHEAIINNDRERLNEIYNELFPKKKEERNRES
jgi:hypothetical protein